MLVNDFITRYKTLPIAYSERNYYCNDNNRESDSDIIQTLMHNHPQIEVLYVLEGSLSMMVSGVRYCLCKGDIIVINPMEMHSIEYSATQEHLHHRCIDFDISILKTPQNPMFIDSLENKKIKFSRYIKFDHPLNRVLRTCFEDIYTAVSEAENGWEYEVCGNLLLFFGKMVANELYLDSVDAPKSVKKNRFVKNVLKYIEENYASQITSLDAAKQIGYNHSYFCRLFKENFNKNFGEYLNIYRIYKARELLEKTDLLVAQISTCVGFNTFSYFTSSFKKYIGVLPSKYRNSKI